MARIPQPLLLLLRPQDSLLNTNPTFDYSAFRELASLAATATPVSTFAFTFLVAGTYAFYMSSNAAAITLINVMAPNVKCGTAAAFVEFSQTNLVTLGVTSNDSIVLSPNWDLIIGLLAGVVGIMLFLMGFIYYFRRRAWNHTMGQVSHSLPHHAPSLPAFTDLPAPFAPFASFACVQAVAAYRDKNKKLADPNASKGGLFSLGNKLNQKVHSSPHNLPTPLSSLLLLTPSPFCTHIRCCRRVARGRTSWTACKTRPTWRRRRPSRAWTWTTRSSSPSWPRRCSPTTTRSTSSSSTSGRCSRGSR